MKAELADETERKFKRIERLISRMTEENRFGMALSVIYHAEGHLVIGSNCKNKPDDFDSPMVYSEVSARDPIFYR